MREKIQLLLYSPRLPQMSPFVRRIKRELLPKTQSKRAEKQEDQDQRLLIRVQFRLGIRPMGVDDLPIPVDPPINLCTIPTNSHLFFSIRPFDSIDKVEGQDGNIAIALNLWINHFVTVDPNLASGGKYVFLHRCQAVDALFSSWIEIRHVRCHDFKVTLRIAFAPAVKRGALDGYYLVSYFGSCYLRKQNVFDVMPIRNKRER